MPGINKGRVLSQAEVQRLCGDVSAMCLWRWERDERLNFPRRFKIGVSRVGWFENQVLAWIAQRAAAATTVAPQRADVARLSAGRSRRPPTRPRGGRGGKKEISARG